MVDSLINKPPGTYLYIATSPMSTGTAQPLNVLIVETNQLELAQKEKAERDAVFTELASVLSQDVGLGGSGRGHRA